MVGTILYIIWVIYKVLLALIVLNFLVFWLLYGFRKSWAVTRWLGLFILIMTAQPLALLFPIAWVLKGLGKKALLFWWVMDDSRFDEKGWNGYANDYWIFIQDRKKTKETFLIALSWHIGRNRVYNLVNLFKVPNSERFNSDGKLIGNNFIRDVEYISDNLHKNDKDKTKMIQDGNWVVMAGLKYIPARKEDDIYQANAGEILSIKTSIIGDGGIWYGVVNWHSFRWSYCKEVKHLFFWKRWRTIKIGTNSNRPVIVIKHQKIKQWQ